MTTIEKFKQAFPDAELNLDTDSIEVYSPTGYHLCSLFHAKELIKEWVGDYNTVESTELDPADRLRVKVSAENYIMMEYGDYYIAFKAI